MSLTKTKKKEKRRKKPFIEHQNNISKSHIKRWIANVTDLNNKLMWSYLIIDYIYSVNHFNTHIQIHKRREFFNNQLQFVLQLSENKGNHQNSCCSITSRWLFTTIDLFHLSIIWIHVCLVVQGFPMWIITHNEWEVHSEISPLLNQIVYVVRIIDVLWDEKFRVVITIESSSYEESNWSKELNIVFCSNYFLSASAAIHHERWETKETLNMIY